MKKLILMCFILMSNIGFSQELLMDTEDVNQADVIEPKFNGGGLDKFYEYIRQEFNYSKVTKAGKLTASFTINEMGEIKNIRIVRVLDDSSAAEFIRVLEKAPKWESAKRGGKPFSVEIKIPLDFK